jgi:LmbE family N-acetylglucosaminyl deacetylase
MKNTLIVFNPHNDDSIISIGGMISKLIKRGWKVGYVYMADGRYGSSSIDSEKLIEIRNKESEMERKFLGIEEVYNFNIEDGKMIYLSDSKKMKIIDKITSILMEKKPSAIALPYSSEVHPDHLSTYEIVMESVSKLKHKPIILFYTVWSLPFFKPKTFEKLDRILVIDVSKEMKRKIETIKLHKSQVKEGFYDQTANLFDKFIALQVQAYIKVNYNYMEIVGMSFFENSDKDIAEILDGLKAYIDVTKIYFGKKEEKIESV